MDFGSSKSMETSPPHTHTMLPDRWTGLTHIYAHKTHTKREYGLKERERHIYTEIVREDKRQRTIAQKKKTLKKISN